MNSAVTRDAERVTAVEIQIQANELESSLGGVYTRLAQDMQLPLATWLIKEIDSELAEIEPVILTGIDSLSRSSEHEQMLMLMNDMAMLNNIPDDIRRVLKSVDLVKLLATNRGIEHAKFIKTQDEIDAEMQAARDAEAQQTAALAAAEQVGQPAQPI